SGDARDRAQERSSGLLVTAAEASQQVDLQGIEWIDVRIPQADRALQNRLPVEELLRLRNLEHRGCRALVLGADRLPKPVVADELQVSLGDLDARLRERHLEVLDQRAEERPLAREAPHVFELGRLEGCATSEPVGK